MKAERNSRCKKINNNPQYYAGRKIKFFSLLVKKIIPQHYARYIEDLTSF